MSLNIDKTTEGCSSTAHSSHAASTHLADISPTTNQETVQLPINTISTSDTITTDPAVVERLAYATNLREHQERTLAQLREKIKIKKQEFTEYVQGPNSAEEEKMDFERALRRFDRLTELPESEIVREYNGIFNMYTESLNNLLDCNARTLNLVLTTTYMPSPQDLNYEVNVKEGIPPTYDDFLGKMIHHLPNWDFITYNFSPDPGNYFYLTGLPIVVQRTIRRDAILDFIVNSQAETNNDRLTQQEEEKIIEMAKRIRESRWQEHRSESLRQTESLTFVNIAPFAGKASRSWHPIIQIDDSITPLQLADRVIHEDYHHHINAQPGNIEIAVYEADHFGDTPCHKHSWALSGKCSSLLDECFTYHADTDFRMLLLERGDLTQEEKIESVNLICSHRNEAQEAFEDLQNNFERLNDDGRKWFSEAKKRWDDLGDRFQKYLDANINSLLNGEDFKTRECGYKAIDSTFIHCPEKQEEYTHKYQAAMKNESNCYVVLDQAQEQSRPPELREIATRRLNNSDIFENLYESISAGLLNQDDDTRLHNYGYLTNAWNICTENRRISLSDLFQASVQKETNHVFLEKILSVVNLPDNLRRIVTK